MSGARDNVKIVVNDDDFETRVTVIEAGRITGFHIERKGEENLLGNVYLGRVVRVIPGMQAAFVDVGLSRSAFLPARQVLSPELREALREQAEGQGDAGGDAEGGGDAGGANSAEISAPRDGQQGQAQGEQRARAPRAGQGRGGRPRGRRGPLSIEQSLKSGSEVIVQIVQQPHGMKGAKVTTYVSLPGHYCVFMPTIGGIGVSRRISDQNKRRRLKKLAQALRVQHEGGFILRTSAASASSEEIEGEANYIATLWKEVVRKGKDQKAPRMLFREWDITNRILRETPDAQIDSITVDSTASFESVRKYLSMAAPHHLPMLVQYKGARPIFDHFGIEQEIERVFQRLVPLPSGGTIVIDQAEALTAIDVNTGSFTGKGSRDAEDTITRTNLEAVKTLAYQLKLRNIGGLIIIDLIDMDQPDNRDKVYQALLNELESDRAKTTVRPISELGLIEMTRERYGDSPIRLLNEKCWYCDGTGSILSKRTVSARLLRAARHAIASTPAGQAITITAHQAVVLSLEHQDRETLERLRTQTRRDIVLVPRVDIHLEYFRVEAGRPGGEG